MTEDKIISIAKGAAIAAVGAALTFVTTAITGVDFGTWTPVVTAGFAVLTNAVRKWMEQVQ